MLETKQATFKARLTSDTVNDKKIWENHLVENLELGLLALKLVDDCDHCRSKLQKIKRVRGGLTIEPLTPTTLEKSI